jgi:uncharacterized protein
MKISTDELRSLPGQRRTFEFKEMLSGLATNKPVVGELTVALNASGLKIFGDVKTLLKLECDRCLRPYFLSLNVNIDEKFVPGDLIPDSGIVDISDVVYQAVTLATPTYCRCGSECPGPPEPADADSGTESGSADKSSRAGKSGAADNSSRPTDPRWENLKTLFPKNDSQ